MCNIEYTLNLRHALIALLYNLPAVMYKIVNWCSMSINIYLLLILDKLRLGQRTFLRKYDNKRTHFYVFMLQNPAIETQTQAYTLTNIQSGMMKSIHEQLGALVATFLYCYISILYSNSCIPSMHFLPSLSLMMMKLTSRTKHNKNQLICNFILLCEKNV